MTESQDELLGSGLVCRIQVPLAWHVPGSADVSGPPDTLHEHVAEDNARCLHAVALLNEHPAEISEELHRLDFKMNLVLEFMGEILARQLDIPPKTLLELSAGAARWDGPLDVMPGVGQLVRLEVYLHPQYPRPLLLFGVVARHDQQGDMVTCQIEFLPMPEPTRDLLEKMIFTHHRREIALRRHHPR